MGAFGSGIFGEGVFGGHTTLEVTADDARYPSRVELVLRELVVGMVVTVSRRPAGSTIRTPVRGADGITATSDVMVLSDAEQPFGVGLTYTLTVDGVDIAEGALTTGAAVGTSSVADEVAAYLVSLKPAAVGVPPVWQSATTLNDAASNLIPIAYPASIAANDILEAVLWINSTTSQCLPPDLTWALKQRVDADNSAFRLEVWWKRAAGGESGTATFLLDAASAREATMHRISGCVTSGDPHDPPAIGYLPAGGTTSPELELFGSTKSSLLFWVGASDTDAGNPWTPPSGYTERADLSGHTVATRANPGGAQPLTVALAGGKVVLSDAVSGAAAEVVVLAWPDKRRARRTSVYAVGGRNIVVSGPRGGFESSLELFVETEEQRVAVDDLLQTATSGILQIRQPGGYYTVDCYVAIPVDTETRWSQDGSDERRVITLDVIETRPWAPKLASSTFTLGDIPLAYPAGATLADLAADYDTLLDIARGDFSS